MREPRTNRGRSGWLSGSAAHSAIGGGLQWRTGRRDRQPSEGQRLLFHGRQSMVVQSREQVDAQRAQRPYEAENEECRYRVPFYCAHAEPLPCHASIRTHWIRMVLMVLSSVASPEFLVRIAKGQMQILRLTTPKLQPADEDLSAGAPELKSVWGPIPTPATKTCRRGPGSLPMNKKSGRTNSAS